MTPRVKLIPRPAPRPAPRRQRTNPAAQRLLQQLWPPAGHSILSFNNNDVFVVDILNRLVRFSMLKGRTLECENN